MYIYRSKRNACLLVRDADFIFMYINVIFGQKTRAVVKKTFTFGPSIYICMVSKTPGKCKYK